MAKYINAKENSMFIGDKTYKELPIIDMVEVVRCKDCKHYWKNKPSDDVPVCLASPRDDAYCSEGEKKHE